MEPFLLGLDDTIRGHKIAMPVYLSSVGGLRAGHIEGELAATRGADRAGTIQWVSGVTSTPIEEIVAQATGSPQARKASTTCSGCFGSRLSRRSCGWASDPSTTSTRRSCACRASQLASGHSARNEVSPWEEYQSGNPS